MEYTWVDDSWYKGGWKIGSSMEKDTSSKPMEVQIGDARKKAD
jgi:hypothetical protein